MGEMFAISFDYIDVSSSGRCTVIDLKGCSLFHNFAKRSVHYVFERDCTIISGDASRCEHIINIVRCRHLGWHNSSVRVGYGASGGAACGRDNI